MPVPKYKRTVYRSKQQTAAWREKILKRLGNYLQFVPCANCGTAKLSHTVCQACAGGAGKQAKQVKGKAVEGKTAEEAKTTKAAKAKVADEKTSGVADEAKSDAAEKAAEKTSEKADVSGGAEPAKQSIEPKLKDLGNIKDTGAHPQDRYQRKSF